jgi:hypothetical protein
LNLRFGSIVRLIRLNLLSERWPLPPLAFMA